MASDRELNTGGQAILVVSFGTSYNESREATIGAVEKAIAKAYPGYEIRRAFTSQMIIDKLAARDGEVIDNVKEAMERLLADGFDRVIVQPTHVMSGYENDEMMEAAAAYEDRFQSVKYGMPLLTGDRDYEELIGVLAEEMIPYDTEDTAIVWMGHGTEHTANASYIKLGDHLKKAGRHNYYIGTVEAVPGLCDVIKEVQKGTYRNVVLVPLMIVSGDHANNDMAGREEDSWSSMFKAAGYDVQCILRGMGEYPGVREIFVRHVREAMIFSK